jgi:Na+/H+-dicarboxylate symporter
MSTRPATPDTSLIGRQGDLNVLISERLWLQVALAMVLGIAVGLALHPEAGLIGPRVSAGIAQWLALPGHLFLAALRFIIVPLILASVVRSIAGFANPSQLGAVGLNAVSFFFAITVLAVALGFALAWLVAPGTYIDAERVSEALGTPTVVVPDEHAPLSFTVPERIVAVVPANITAAMASGEILQVVIGAAIFGIALLQLPGDEAKPLLDLMAALQAACMVMVRWVMRLAPLAVFGLLAEVAARVGLEAVVGMSAYVGTVLLGLLILMLLYVGLVAHLAHRSPAEFVSASRDLMLMAFATSSSAAVMPLSLKTAEERLGVRPEIARFVIPIGTTINMAGTAIYQVIACMFLAQLFAIPLGISGMLVVVLIAIGSAVGSPGTPSVGIVVTATILESIGIPAAGVALVIGVDRILDMSRTVVNVTGDVAASLVVDRRTAKLLADDPPG